MGQSADTGCGEAAVVGVIGGLRGTCPPGGGAAKRGRAPASGRDGAARAPDALPPRAGLSPGSHGRGCEGSGARLGLPRGRRVPVTPQAPDRPGQSRHQA